ncbi:sigma-70 family RNA polymerase sigma factor [Bacillus sp. BGMRC 2118]|nr:sigma-70 family RNA polymerase sigma factor [Bacillus sp. BGMRC 2118]
MIENDDKVLYVRVLEKDKQALELLYERYEKLLYSFSYRLTQDQELAEEVVQEVFMKLWKGLGKYDDSKGKFSSWILTVTRHSAIDLIRKRNRETTVELDTDDTIPSKEATVEEQVEWNEKGNTLRKALSSLKEEQQKVINLVYFKGLTHQKISEECNIPIGTVKGRLRLALRHMKSYLETERRDLGGE